MKKILIPTLAIVLGCIAIYIIKFTGVSTTAVQSSCTTSNVQIAETPQIDQTTSPQIAEQPSEVQHVKENKVTEVSEDVISSAEKEKASKPAKKAKAVIEITKQNIEKEVYKSDLPVVLDVYSTACPPCKKLAPVIEELSGEYSGTFKFAKLNIDKEFMLGNQYKVTSLPTLLFITNNQVKGRTTGFHNKQEIKEKLATYFTSS